MLYAKRPYLSRATVIVSSPGEVFPLTEGLLMDDTFFPFFALSAHSAVKSCFFLCLLFAASYNACYP